MTRTRTGEAPNAKNRPNKLSRGMTQTAWRSGHTLEGDALTLAVNGTLDILGRVYYRNFTVRAITTYRYSISKRGQLKLERLRRIREGKNPKL